MISLADKSRWVELEDGRRAWRDREGIIRLPTERVEQIIPLAQYFETKLRDQYKSVSLNQFQVSYDEALKKAKGFAMGYVNKWKQIEGQGKGYYLYSQKPGSGKTMLACGILNGLSAKYKLTTQAINTVDLLKRIKETYDNPDLSEVAVLNPVIAVDVLLLDDIGAERHSEWADEQMYHIIESRLSCGKPTFFTSNMSIDQLPYHGRVKSRVNSITAQIRMPEKDIRAIVARQKQQEFLNQITK